MKAVNSCLVVLLFAAVAGSAVALQESRVSPDEAGEHVGEEVTVDGRVFLTRRTNSGVHLYFSPDASTAFQVLIPSGVLHKFKVDPTVRYEKRNLQVTGKVEEDGGRYFIRVDDPADIKIVRRRRRSE